MPWPDRGNWRPQPPAVSAVSFRGSRRSLCRIPDLTPPSPRRCCALCAPLGASTTQRRRLPGAALICAGAPRAVRCGTAAEPGAPGVAARSGELAVAAVAGSGGRLPGEPSPLALPLFRTAPRHGGCDAEFSRRCVVGVPAGYRCETWSVRCRAWRGRAGGRSRIPFQQPIFGGAAAAAFAALLDRSSPSARDAGRGAANRGLAQPTHDERGAGGRLGPVRRGYSDRVPRGYGHLRRLPWAALTRASVLRVVPYCATSGGGAVYRRRWPCGAVSCAGVRRRAIARSAGCRWWLPGGVRFRAAAPRAVRCGFLRNPGRGWRGRGGRAGGCSCMPVLRPGKAERAVAAARR